MLTRRALVVGAPFALAGCTTLDGLRPMAGDNHDPNAAAIYGAVVDEPFPVPAVDLSRVDPKFYRSTVAYPTREAAGTIVVDPGQRFAYLVQGGGRAIRYGVGVGKNEAFNFRGVAIIARKAEWPRWVPTPDMIRREPKRYGPYAGGMAGGVGNPLGPRALYLYADGRDTYYRLHGTVEPWTIGTMVSSGCVRLLNQDIIDLYRRVPVGTKVVVLPAHGGLA
jgi:lipoprotein-anchoring transpeptidase ErfK/SrfK